MPFALRQSEWVLSAGVTLRNDKSARNTAPKNVAHFETEIMTLTSHELTTIREQCGAALGWRKPVSFGTHWNNPHGALATLPNFPTDIAAAWLLVDHMTGRGYDYLMSGNRAQSMVVFWMQPATTNTPEYAPGLPLAICLAFLKVNSK